MRSSIVLRFALTLMCVSAPALIHAQFQPPSDEELKMTSDPKAPGAAAVYLNREETTDDTLHYHSYYERIKVLTEKGKEYATIHIPYERGQYKVTDIKGRTIHADGTVIPLTVKPEIFRPTGGSRPAAGERLLSINYGQSLSPNRPGK